MKKEEFKYPIWDCKYNPARDIKAVSPDGALDLKSAFANNAIPANLNATENAFNDIAEPAAIGARVTDAIDAEVLEHSIKNYKAPKPDAAE